MEKILIKCIIFFISISNLYCQNKTIKGRIIDEHLESMPMVSIFNNYNVELGKTDMNGFFQIEIPICENKLLFRFIGLESLNVQLIDECKNLEIVMILESTYDFITLKKADKLREQRLNKTEKYHKLAFEKGIFETDKACYVQKIIPYCEKKDDVLKYIHH